MNLIRRNPQTWVDPFDVISDLQEDLNRIFSGSLKRVRDRDFPGALYSPELELSEDPENFILRADVPGVPKDQIQIHFTGNVLELKGERKEEKERKEKGIYLSECRYGSFSRVIEFPAQVQADKARAAYKDGVLEITVPKAESAKPKQVKIDLK